MSILNVNQIQPVGGGNTITVTASDVSASGATITASRFVGNVTSEFSAGLNVTGGSVGIGTDNPSRLLHLFDIDAPPLLIDRDQSGERYAVELRQSDTTDGNAFRLAYQSDTTGAGAASDVNFASIEFAADTHDQATRAGSIRFRTSQGGVGNEIERLRITSDGNIGIGTDNPQHNLHLYNNGDATLFIQADADNVDETHNPKISMSQDGLTSSIFDLGINGTAGDAFTGALANTAYLYSVSNATSNGIQFATNGAARMYLNNSGNLGIGTDNPSYGQSNPVSTYNPKLGVEGSIIIGNLSTTASDRSELQFYRRAGTYSQSIDAHDMGRIAWYGSNNDANNASLAWSIGVNPDGGTWTSGSNRKGYMTFNNHDGEKIRISSTGNVGIGTDNPNHKLTLSQSGTGTFDAINFVTGNTNSSGYQMGVSSGSEVFHWNTTNSSINFATNNSEKFRITTNVGPWAEGNKGVDPGTIHLRPDATDHMGGAITFGASDSGGGYSAMAGIYTRSDGSYGTKMYLATTDSYAVGPKNFLEADQHGRIRTPRQPWIFGSPTNTGGSGIFNDLKDSSSRGGLAFTTDRITVSREGVYLICFNTICDSSSIRRDATIKVNGNTIVNTLSENSTAGYHYRGASICYYLNENDYIQVANDDWYDPTNSTNWKTLSVAYLG